MVDDAEGVPTGVTVTSAGDSTANRAGLVGRSVAGKFVIEALVASGGAGTVYRARQLALDRIVALKVLHQDVARDGHFVERFKREARAASRLDHPNSVRVFDFGHVDEATLYLAMEYVEGRTLHDIITAEWPLGDARIVDIMSQVLSAIAVAHEMEVIHRDLKPDNIMIIRTIGDDGEDAEVAKVCDFGIATLGAVQHDGSGERAAGPWATNDGTLVGTPGYMSPEQARGGQADRRSDIYSAGVILYHLLTGRPPFEGESAYFVAMKHITEHPAPPSALAAVNPELEAVCLRALRKVPDERFGSAREMRAALRAGLARTTPAGALAASIDLTPRPAAPPPDTGEMRKIAGTGSARRRRAFAAAWGLAAAGLVGGAFAARSMLWPAAMQAPSLPPTATVAVAPPPPAAATSAASPGEIASAPQAEAPPAPPRAPAKTARPGRGTRARPAPDHGLARAANAGVAKVPARAAATAPFAPPAPTVVAAPPLAPAEPPPSATPAAPTTAPPPPKLAAPRIDVEHATASITALTTTSAIPNSNVRAALARVPLVRCYRDALRAGGMMSATAVLHLHIDKDGYVTGANLQGAGVTALLKACIEKAATAARVKDVDTGDAAADVTLSFVAAP